MSNKSYSVNLRGSANKREANMKPSFVISVILIAAGILIYFFVRSDGGASALTGVMTTIETAQGNIVVELYPSDAPKTVANFLTLARAGFYDGVTFHRVIPGFMIQGGDPNCGKNGGADGGQCGAGGPGYQFADELNPATASYKRGYVKGALAMANAGPNTNGSQFFIVVADYPLPHNYTIFGRVVEGQEVADAISNVKRNANDRPLEAVVIRRVITE